MGNIYFTLFTLSAVKVLRLDIILEVGDRENYSNASSILVRTRETQTPKCLPLVPEFTCQGYLVTTLDVFNLWGIST